MLAGRGALLGLLGVVRLVAVGRETGGEQALEGDRPPGVGLLGTRYSASGEGSLNRGPADTTPAGGLGCGPAGALAGRRGGLLGLVGALLGGVPGGRLGGHAL